MNLESMQTRSLECRAKIDGLTIEGIGVPFNREIAFGNWYEQFAPGSIDDAGAILRYGHSEPIGVITHSEDTANGRKITARISDTQRGRDIAQLIRDGALTKLSIGFEPIEYETRDDGDSTHITYTNVRAREFSVVEFPAYSDATISEIRTQPDTTQPERPQMNLEEIRSQISDAIAPLTTAIDDCEREIRSMRTASASTEKPFEYRSFGAYAKALAAREEMAVRAYEGATLAQAVARPAWLGSLEKRMQAKQVVSNLFTHTFDLPSEGMTVEYAAKKGASTISVDSDHKEGEALPTGKPAPYEVKTATVMTYSGGAEISFEAVERASISLLDDILYDQAFTYATAIENKTRELFNAAVTTAENTPLKTIANLNSATVNDWTDFVIALIDAYDNTPYVLDGLAVSPQVFQSLAALDRSPKALQFSSAPVDHQGTITLQTGRGDFATITVQRVPNWTGKHAVGFSSEAIRVQEAPGAPYRLQDSQIFSLTKQFAVYGYAAHYTPRPELIKAVKFNA